MPLIKVLSSVAAPDQDTIETLLKQLSMKLAQHLRKPESYVMTSFEPNIAMSFAGTFDAPVCFMEVKSIGNMTPEQTKAMSQDFCEHIQTHLGVPLDRIYIEFVDAERAMWGWDGRTFA